MKKSISAVFIVAVALLTLSAQVVAQQNPYLVKVPFAFSAGTQVFPAGEYRVLEVRQGIVLIRGVDNNTSTYMVTTFISGNADQPMIARLVFHQYGRRYFLSQVWFDGSRTGDKLKVSEEELQEAKLGPGSETVLLPGSK